MLEAEERKLRTENPKLTYLPEDFWGRPTRIAD